MFSSLFPVMHQLKQDLDAINGSPLSQNTEVLKNTKITQHLFVNPNILPRDIVIEENVIASLEERDDYSRKVLQAWWNIADGCSSRSSMVLNNRVINKSCQFLAPDYAPKIVDDRTYQMHCPETLSSSIRSIKFKRERESVRLHYVTQLKDALEKIAQNMRMNQGIFETELERAGTEEIELKLKGLAELTVQYENTVESFRQSNETWHRENMQGPLLPDTIQISRFIQHLSIERMELANQQELDIINQEIKSLWSALYNENTVLYDEGIASSLTSHYLLKLFQDDLNRIPVTKIQVEKPMLAN